MRFSLWLADNTEGNIKSEFHLQKIKFVLLFLASIKRFECDTVD